MKNNYLYVLVDSKNRTHYGAFVNDDVLAREKAKEYEKLNNLPAGQIEIYEIPEWEIHR